MRVGQSSAKGALTLPLLSSLSFGRSPWDFSEPSCNFEFNDLKFLVAPIIKKKKKPEKKQNYF